MEKSILIPVAIIVFVFWMASLGAVYNKGKKDQSIHDLNTFMTYVQKGKIVVTGD